MRAAVVARDEALRDSLTLLLQAVGFEAIAFANVEILLAQTRSDEKFVFIDDAQAGQTRALVELRSRGWRGMAVIMTEGLPQRQSAVPDGPTSTLEKPFSANDVLAILSQDGGGEA